MHGPASKRIKNFFAQAIPHNRYPLCQAAIKPLTRIYLAAIIIESIEDKPSSFH
jgi:hypothetical protein